MITVCFSASTIYYPSGGGHMWVYLNWVMGLIENGCNVIWLEEIKSSIPFEKNWDLVSILKEKLADFNLQDNLALWQSNDELLFDAKLYKCINVDSVAMQSDLIINQDYVMPPNILSKFKKKALLDIDPGLLQMWIHKKALFVAPHDFYFTTGETVGSKDSPIPDCNIEWLHLPPCIAIDYWPRVDCPPNAPFTSVTHWATNEWNEDNLGIYLNDKRTGFAPYFEIPLHVTVALELALLFGDEEKEDRPMLEKNGWSIKDSHTVAGTTGDYQNYIQQSAGEFSCVKPSCIRFQNAWISDRSLCYLASGKPVVVEHTGPSKFLPDNAGLLRFKNFNEAVKCLEEVATNYDKHATYARQLAEEYFDAKKVCKQLLERVF